MSTIATLPAELRTEARDGEVKSTCCHHWLIESPNGSISRGVCKFCKEERVFNNSAERYLIKKR